MSPEGICPNCGNKVVFHEDEMEGVKAGTVVCTECGLERQYHEFLAEVLDGKHPELIQQIEEELSDG